MSYQDLMQLAGIFAGMVFGVFIGRWQEARGSLARRLNDVEEQLASQTEEQAPQSSMPKEDWRNAVMGG